MRGLPDIPPGIEKKANAALAALVDSLADVQPDYQTAHGRYWQGLAPAPIPDDGSETTPNPHVKPTDQAEDYDDAGVEIPSHSCITFTTDVLNGPEGLGYQVTGWIRIAGKVWNRAVAVGAHTQSWDWREVNEEAV